MVDTAGGTGVPSAPRSPLEAHEGLEATGVPSSPGARGAGDGRSGVISGPPATIGRARGFRVRQRTGAWPAGGTPRVDPNSLESVADDVALWIETSAQEVSRAMMDGMYAPFSARISQGD